MKTIAYRDIQGGSLYGYFCEGETRHERIRNALKDLRHMARIRVYLINGNKTRWLFSKGY